MEEYQLKATWEQGKGDEGESSHGKLQNKRAKDPYIFKMDITDRHLKYKYKARWISTSHIFQVYARTLSQMNSSLVYPNTPDGRKISDGYP